MNKEEGKSRVDAASEFVRHGHARSPHHIEEKNISSSKKERSRDEECHCCEEQKRNDGFPRAFPIIHKRSRVIEEFHDVGEGEFE